MACRYLFPRKYTPLIITRGSAGTEVELVFLRNSKHIMVKVLRDGAVRVSSEVVDLCKPKTDRLPADNLRSANSGCISESRSDIVQCSIPQSVDAHLLENENVTCETAFLSHELLASINQPNCFREARDEFASSLKTGNSGEIVAADCYSDLKNKSGTVKATSGTVKATLPRHEIVMAETFPACKGELLVLTPAQDSIFTQASVGDKKDPVKTELLNNNANHRKAIHSTLPRQEGADADPRGKRRSRWGPIEGSSVVEGRKSQEKQLGEFDSTSQIRNATIETEAGENGVRPSATEDAAPNKSYISERGSGLEKCEQPDSNTTETRLSPAFNVTEGIDIPLWNSFCEESSKAQGDDAQNQPGSSDFCQV